MKSHVQMIVILMSSPHKRNKEATRPQIPIRCIFQSIQSNYRPIWSIRRSFDLNGMQKCRKYMQKVLSLIGHSNSVRRSSHQFIRFFVVPSNFCFQQNIHLFVRSFVGSRLIDCVRIKSWAYWFLFFFLFVSSKVISHYFFVTFEATNGVRAMHTYMKISN